MKKIIVTKRTDDWHACDSSNSGIWGCGPDPYSAVSQCVHAHKEHFNLFVQRDQKKDHVFGKEICQSKEIEVHLN